MTSMSEVLHEDDPGKEGNLSAEEYNEHFNDDGIDLHEIPAEVLYEAEEALNMPAVLEAGDAEPIEGEDVGGELYDAAAAPLAESVEAESMPDERHDDSTGSEA